MLPGRNQAPLNLKDKRGGLCHKSVLRRPLEPCHAFYGFAALVQLCGTQRSSGVVQTRAPLQNKQNATTPRLADVCFGRRGVRRTKGPLKRQQSSQSSPGKATPPAYPGVRAGSVPFQPGKNQNALKDAGLSTASFSEAAGLRGASPAGWPAGGHCGERGHVRVV